MKIPTVPKHSPRVAPLESVQRLLNAPLEHWCDYRNRALIHLLLDTGICIGEACSLTVPHINLKHRLLHVPPGKDKEYRYTPFTKQCAVVIAEYLEHRPGGSQYVFLRKNGKRLLVSHAGYALRCFCQRMGVEYINAHSIRHLFATKALNDGVRGEGKQNYGAFQCRLHNEVLCVAHDGHDSTRVRASLENVIQLPRGKL